MKMILQIEMMKTIVLKYKGINMRKHIWYVCGIYLLIATTGYAMETQGTHGVVKQGPICV